MHADNEDRAGKRGWRMEAGAGAAAAARAPVLAHEELERFRGGGRQEEARQQLQEARQQRVQARVLLRAALGALQAQRGRPEQRAAKRLEARLRVRQLAQACTQAGARWGSLLKPNPTLSRRRNVGGGSGARPCPQRPLCPRLPLSARHWAPGCRPRRSQGRAQLGAAPTASDLRACQLGQPSAY